MLFEKAAAVPAHFFEIHWVIVGPSERFSQTYWVVRRYLQAKACGPYEAVKFVSPSSNGKNRTPSSHLFEYL